MSARALLTLTLVAAGALVPAATADAARKPASKYPTVKSIQPIQAVVGDTLTIKGTGFVKGKGRNTVVFRRDGKRAIFVKADGLSTTRLKVKLPERLSSELAVISGVPSATRFRVRILARRFGRTYTKLKASPVILPTEAAKAAATPKATAAAPAPAPAAPAPAPDCDGDGTPDSADANDDTDLLSDETEQKIGTDRCSADTDGDGMDDGWEWKSAMDLNQRSCPPSTLEAGNASSTWDYPRPCPSALPYPSSPYTNPLRADRNEDFDGDSMPAWAEYKAFKRKAEQDAAWNTLDALWYSDGKQASVDTAAEPNTCVGMGFVDVPFGGKTDYPEFVDGDGNTPVFTDGLGNVKPEYAIYLPSRDANDECLDDSERDEDGDFLSNYEELLGPISGPGWWNGVFSEPIYQLLYTGTDWLSADSDKDTVIDGLDDQDFDDFLNIEELYRWNGGPTANKNAGTVWASDGDRPTGSYTGLWVDPFNPCLPAVYSRTCKRRVEVGATNPYKPFTADPVKNAPAPRWPLYGYAYYGGVQYTDPDFVDDPADPNDKAATLVAPPELWSGLPAVDQTYPPLHPLPRP